MPSGSSEVLLFFEYNLAVKKASSEIIIECLLHNIRALSQIPFG